jgi:hypothetical protein
VDLFATVLDTLGVPVPTVPHSRSLLPLLAAGTARHREAVVYGTFGQGVCVTDGDWTLFKSPPRDEPLFFYSSSIYRSIDAADEPDPPVGQGYFIPGVRYPQWKIPTRYRVLSREDFLFHRAADPGQTRNLWVEAPDQRRRMLGVLRDLLAAEGTPPEQYTRLGLRPDAG